MHSVIMQQHTLPHSKRSIVACPEGSCASAMCCLQCVAPHTMLPPDPLVRPRGDVSWPRGCCQPLQSAMKSFAALTFCWGQHVARASRVCRHCGGVAVADEVHVIIQRPALHTLRQRYRCAPLFKVSTDTETNGGMA